MNGSKKTRDVNQAVRRSWLDSSNPDLSLSRQCELLGVSRSSIYYKSQEESTLNLELMRLIDEQYTKTPFYGSRRMTEWLKRGGYRVNRKRVRRLMELLGLQGIAPGKRLTKGNKRHKRYPYLLEGVTIDKKD